MALTKKKILTTICSIILLAYGVASDNSRHNTKSEKKTPLRELASDYQFKRYELTESVEQLRELCQTKAPVSSMIIEYMDEFADSLTEAFGNTKFIDYIDPYSGNNVDLELLEQKERLDSEELRYKSLNVLVKNKYGLLFSAVDEGVDEIFIGYDNQGNKLKMQPEFNVLDHTKDHIKLAQTKWGKLFFNPNSIDSAHCELANEIYSNNMETLRDGFIIAVIEPKIRQIEEQIVKLDHANGKYFPINLR